MIKKLSIFNNQLTLLKALLRAKLLKFYKTYPPKKIKKILILKCNNRWTISNCFQSNNKRLTSNYRKRLPRQQLGMLVKMQIRKSQMKYQINHNKLIKMMMMKRRIIKTRITLIKMIKNIMRIMKTKEKTRIIKTGLYDNKCSNFYNRNPLMIKLF